MVKSQKTRGTWRCLVSHLSCGKTNQKMRGTQRRMVSPQTCGKKSKDARYLESFGLTFNMWLKVKRRDVLGIIWFHA